MTHSEETVFSMEDTESSDYLSSSDSMYSLDSASSVEDDYDDFDVFLSDGCDEEDKDAVDNGRQGDATNTGRLVLAPEAELTTSMKSSLKCLDNQYHTLTGLQSMGNIHATHPCTRYPFVFENATISSNHSWVMNKNANVPVRTDNQKNEDGGLKRPIHPVMESERTEPVVPSEAPGVKRSRSRGEDDVWRRAGLTKRCVESPKSDGDRIFAEKCKELQGFIKPLTGLLNGLKRGRFERGLSSFQQSVAMDRIQRIVGVLQKPEMGERYLGTLLQVERMLKVWFPNVAMNSSSPPEHGEEETEDKRETHEHHNCPEIKSSPRQQAKRFAHSSNSPWRRNPRKAHDVMLPTEADCESKATGKERVPPYADWSAMNLTWMHTSPIPNPPLSQADLGHLNTPIGQSPLGQNTNCGFILFLHNNSVSSQSYPRSTSSFSEKSPTMFCHLKEHSVQTGDPPRSLSAPGSSTVSIGRMLEVDGDHSRSRYRLPRPSKRPLNVR